MSQNDLPSAGTTIPEAADGLPAGTTAADVAGGVPETSAETPEQLRARLAEAERKFQELLRMKDNAEAIARENEALRAQLQPPTSQQDETAARLQRANMQLQEAARNGDDTALAILALMSAAQQQPRQLMQRIDMLEVPKDERAEVERVQRERYARGEWVSAETARELLTAQKLAKQSADLARREAELRATEEARARGVVATRVTGVPAAEAKTQENMTYSQFRQAWDNATPEQRDEIMRKTGGGKNLVPD